MGYLQFHLVSLWPNGTHLQTYNDCVLCAQKHRPSAVQNKNTSLSGIIAFNSNCLSSLCSRFKLKMGIELQTVN